MHPILIIIFLFLTFWVIKTRRFPLRFPSTGFKYVHVEFDGTVRELDSDEQQYLLEEFHPNDGNRPYIKSNYWERTPDQKIHGFLKRNRVPWWIEIVADSLTPGIKNNKIDNAFFMFGCKNLHFLGIRPFSSQQINSSEYQDLILAGVTVLTQGGLQNFMNNLMESQYSIPVWTSKIALEYGNISQDEILEINGSKTILEICFETLKYNTDDWNQNDIVYYQNWINSMNKKYGLV